MTISKESGIDAGVPRSWGHFTLLELVGTGASGEVWRAWDAGLADVGAYPLFRSLRGDAGWRAFLAKMGLGSG